MSKTLVLFTDNKSYYFDRINYSDICIKSIYKENITFIGNIILKILRKLSLPLTKWFYEEWYKCLNEYDKIIVLDSTLLIDENILKNITDKAPRSERYFYSWNIVKNEKLYRKQRKSVDEANFKYYCYDHGDCKKYNMYFNTIMYDKNLSLENIKPQNDAVFLGFVKDRKEKMESLYKSIIEAELNPRFIIVNAGKEGRNSYFEYRDEYVNYYEYLRFINSSRAIIDINQNCQDGYSMRIMEAIFFNKKLITTNKAVKNSNFYNSNNILIIELGKTTKDEIKKFFELEFIPYPIEIREYYSFEAWTKRFK